MDATYIRGLLQGLRNAAEQGQEFQWDPVIELCQWVVQQPREVREVNQTTYFERDLDWGNARGAVANLLSAGFVTNTKSVIPFVLRQATWNVIEPLTTDPEPTAEYEANYGGSNMNPATLSLNTVRGEAMHCVIRYALWLEGHLKNDTEVTETAISPVSFQKMPEVQRILEQHLDSSFDSSTAVRAVYGQWVPWIIRIDREWVRLNINAVFPKEKASENLRLASWNTYTQYCQAYPEVYSLLYDEYRWAVEQLGNHQSRTVQIEAHSLVSHLMQLYWRGSISFEKSDDLLKLFYDRADDSMRSEAVKIITPILNNESANWPSEPLKRFERLWSFRLDVMENAPTEYIKEAVAFVWWFIAPGFDDGWAIHALKRTLTLCLKVSNNRQNTYRHSFAEGSTVERLKKLIPTHTGDVIYCFNLMVDLDADGWRIESWQDALRTAIETAIKNNDATIADQAIELADRLVGRGFFDFRRYVTP